MKIRAVIFDVYGTLLQVGPPPTDADARWRSLFRDAFHAEPKLSRLEFAVACNHLIAQRHASAHARGISFPEICWPSVVAAVLPEFARLAAGAQEEFLFQHIQTGRTTHLHAGAAEALRWLAGNHCALGIASNAQAYSLRELAEGLGSAGLDLSAFERELCFWSYQHGFSKPDPHVFQILLTRLEARGIGPAETLMVGDRLDNDVEPAQAQGFQRWWLSENPSSTGLAGDWKKLSEWLRRNA
jgi:FMN phosphatase YigB (HAD superfamily)